MSESTAPKVTFQPTQRTVTIGSDGQIDFSDLYSIIREWEGSLSGISYDAILEGSGNIQLPDGSRTPRCMIFINDWTLRSNSDVSIVNGYVTGRERRNYRDPISPDSVGIIRLLSDADEESEFVPTDAQKQYVLELGEEFGNDWEVSTQPSLVLQRKPNASDKVYKVLALYWFLKQEFLRNQEVRKFSFPIASDNEPPIHGQSRKWQWSPGWRITPEDLKFLSGGPLVSDGTELVPPDPAAKTVLTEKKEELATQEDYPAKRQRVLRKVRNSVLSLLGYAPTVRIDLSVFKQMAQKSV